MGTSAGIVDQNTPELQAALGAWAHGQRDRSLELFDQAVRKSPTNVRVLVNAARCHGLQHRPLKMRELLERAAKASDDHPMIWRFIAQTYRMLRLTREAIAAYQRAIERGDTDAVSAIELAMLHESLAETDEGQRVLECVGDTGPEAVMAFRQYASALLARQSGDKDAAREQLEAVTELAYTEATGTVINYAWSQLALLHDAAGAYDKAHESMLKSKRGGGGQGATAHAKQARAAADQHRAHFQSISDRLTRETAERWFAPADAGAACPAAMLIGYPRSGTTLLENILEAHDRVRSVEERDVLEQVALPGVTATAGDGVMAADRIDAASRQQLKRARKRYMESLEQWVGEPITGRVAIDKNPGGTPMSSLFMRVVPEGKLIMTIRDPRDVLLSCFSRYVEHDPAGIEYHTMESAASRYALEIGIWLRLRELIPGRFVQVRYEDLVREPEAECRRVVEALGLEWSDDLMNYRDRLVGKAITSPSAAAVRAPINTKAIGRWKHYPELFEPVRETLAPFVDAFGYEA